MKLLEILSINAISITKTLSFLIEVPFLIEIKSVVAYTS